MVRCQTFSFSFFPCSADHERDWSPCKVVFFGLATNALNVRNNNNNNNNNLTADATADMAAQQRMLERMAEAPPLAQLAATAAAVATRSGAASNENIL